MPDIGVQLKWPNTGTPHNQHDLVPTPSSESVVNSDMLSTIPFLSYVCSLSSHHYSDLSCRARRSWWTDGNRIMHSKNLSPSDLILEKPSS